MKKNELRSQLSLIVNNLKKFSGEKIVIKCGGKMLDNEEQMKAFANDIATLNAFGIVIILVHGAGKIRLDSMLEKLGLENNFTNGYRVANKEGIDIVEMVMSGSINTSILKYLLEQKIHAIGLSCKDGNLVSVKRIRRTKKDESSNIEKIIDLGFVGDPVASNVEFLSDLLETYNCVPVISPMAFDDKFSTYTINADVLACYLGEVMGAKRVVIMSENYSIKSDIGFINGDIDVKRLQQMIDDSDIDENILIRLNACMNAVKNGVEKVHIVNTDLENALIEELSSDISHSTAIYSE